MSSVAVKHFCCNCFQQRVVVTERREAGGFHSVDRCIFYSITWREHKTIVVEPSFPTPCKIWDYPRPPFAPSKMETCPTVGQYIHTKMHILLLEETPPLVIGTVERHEKSRD